MPTLHLAVFWCREIDTYYVLTPRLFRGARTYAKQYGFELEILPQYVRDKQFVLPFIGQVIPESLSKSRDQSLLNKIANENVRGLCDAAFRGEKRVPVVLGGLGETNNGWSGYTVQSASRSDEYGRPVMVTSSWPPWSIIDPVKAVSYDWLVIHELVHASGFMNVGPYSHVNDRNDLMNKNSDETVANPKMSDAAKTSLTNAYFCW